MVPDPVQIQVSRMDGDHQRTRNQQVMVHTRLSSPTLMVLPSPDNPVRMDIARMGTLTRLLDRRVSLLNNSRASHHSSKASHRSSRATLTRTLLLLPLGMYRLRDNRPSSHSSNNRFLVDMGLSRRADTRGFSRMCRILNKDRRLILLNSSNSSSNRLYRVSLSRCSSNNRFSSPFSRSKFRRNNLCQFSNNLLLCNSPSRFSSSRSSRFSCNLSQFNNNNLSRSSNNLSRSSNNLSRSSNNLSRSSSNQFNRCINNRYLNSKNNSLSRRSFRPNLSGALHPLLTPIAPLLSLRHMAKFSFSLNRNHKGNNNHTRHSRCNLNPNPRLRRNLNLNHSSSRNHNSRSRGRLRSFMMRRIRMRTRMCRRGHSIMLRAVGI
ncbi:hypothetical protein M413DRAFT_244890 [Hebeloma cylindrosporum]|uniref:Uncharacterized protein n=1 Tax=Hebeloma cylindrosporum TaxID=76867 RepID=A0A0C2YBG0_HEBCY|nr:hypothetical protein M413DRAFT_244890 [Hebeloma cylindrosporum h7]